MTETVQQFRLKAKKLGRKQIWPLAALVLLIFYAVGFWGLAFSNNPVYFQNLTPFNLLLTNAILFSFQRDASKIFWLFAGIVFCIGYSAELLGIHTGLLFGDYQYGEALGWKVAEVPLLIGLNWVMLVYSSGHLVNLIKINVWLRALLGTFLMLGLDYLIEPVAMQFDFRSWKDLQIPLSNFIGWFLITLPLQLLFQLLHFRKDNPLAPFVFLLQVVFFLLLYISI